jgi:Predicted transcriptional regulators
MKIPHPADVHVGQKLNQLRKMRGVSQKDLGERLDNPITFQQLQKYEKGANRLSASRLWELSVALEVPPAYFFEGLEGGNHVDTSLPGPVMKAAGQLSTLPKSVQDNIIFIINEISGNYHRDN